MAEVTLLARIQLLIQREEDIHRLARALEELGIKIEQAQMKTARWGRGLFAFHMALLGLTFSFWSFTRQLTSFIDQASEGMRELEETVAKTTAMMMLHYEDAFERMEALRDLAREMAETSPFPQERILQALAYADAIGLGVAQFKELTPIIELASIVLGDYEKASRGVIDFIMFGNKAILRRIGLMITKEDLEREAIRLYGVEYSKLESLAQAYVRYNLLLEHASRISSDYQGKIQELVQAIDELRQKQSLLNNLWMAMPPAIREGIQGFSRFIDVAGRIGTLAMTFVMVVSSIKILQNAIGYASNLMAEAGGSAGFLALAFGKLGALAKVLGVGLAGLGVVLGAFAVASRYDTQIANSFAESIWNLQLAIYQFSGGLLSASPYVTHFGHLLAEAKEKVHELRDAMLELSTISFQLQSAQAGLNSIMMRLDELYRKRLTLETRLTSLLNKKARLEDAIRRLEERRKEIQEILANWSDRVKEAEREIARARLRVARASLRIQQIELQMAQTRARLGDIAMRLRRQTFEIARARWRVAEATFRLQEAERRLREEREKLIDIQRQIEIAENRLEIARYKYGESSWEVWEAERDLEILRDRLEDQQWKVRDAEMQVESARLGVQDATLRVQEAIWRYNEIAREQAEVHLRLQMLELQRQEAILQLQEAQDDLNKAMKDYNDLAKERKTYEDELTRIDDELERKTRELADTEAQIQSVKQDLADILDEIGDLEKKRAYYTDLISKLMEAQEETINEKYLPALEKVKKVYQDIVELQKEAKEGIKDTVRTIGWAVEQLTKPILTLLGFGQQLLNLINQLTGRRIPTPQPAQWAYQAPTAQPPAGASETTINIKVDVITDGTAYAEDIADAIAKEMERRLKERYYSYYGVY